MFWLIGGIALFDLAAECGPQILRLNFPSKDLHHQSRPLAVGLLSGAAIQCPGQSLLPTRSWYGRLDHPLSLGSFRWFEQPRWKWAVFTGGCAGLAVLTKAVAVYTIGGMLIAVCFRSTRKKAGLSLAHTPDLTQSASLVHPSIRFCPPWLLLASRGDRHPNF